ncbi:MAG: hypothetical protein ACKO3W_00070 [bacterium]
MKILATLARVLLAAFTLASVTPALASDAVGPYSPVGIWEIKVGGLFEGESVNGQAYIEFDGAGSVSGYYLSRMASSLYEVTGTWQQADKKFTGSITVSDGDGPAVVFGMTGAARASKSIAARLEDGSGSRVALIGKPLVTMPNLAGPYFGTLRQYGTTGLLSLMLTPDNTVSYSVDGLLQFGGQNYDLQGYVVVNRSGKYVAYVRNLDNGVYASIWGKITPGGVFAGSGRSLDDGSTISVRLLPD